MPKILCLHGMGTNSQILQWQLGPFLQTLDHSHSLTFIEGEIPCPPAPGLDDAPGPHLCYHKTPSTTEIAEALEQISSSCEEGPFDGIIGFSQGAALAASVILHHQQQGGGKGPPPFKFAIFFSSFLPFSPDLDSIPPERIEHLLSSSTNLPPSLADLLTNLPSSLTSYRPYHPAFTAHLIKIPTLHIIGKNDPLIAQSKTLYELCDPSERKLVEHVGGHEIPRDEKSLRQIGALARKVVERGGALVASGVIG